MKRVIRTHWMAVGILAGVVAGACMKKQEAPPLSGPSEFGTSIGVTITPDVITQDGASQSVITVTARDTAGQPVRNVAIRLETLVDGALVDFGSLSARTVVTGNDGRATATYTAPASSLNGTDRLVTIAATPIGSDFGNAIARTATIRLVPQGVVNPPAGLVPAFVSSPLSPVEDTTVLFNASTSQANTTIASYTWAFGNGQTGSGVTATTTYDDPGSYFVTLTIRDEFGRSASTTNTVTVIAGTRPTAAFTMSPTNPRTGDLVSFNAAGSTVPSGRTIVSYVWDFGDSSPFGSGPTAGHSYSFARTYTVVLTVTDNTGQSASTSQTLAVAPASVNATVK
jgi:PKD repeat protein